MVAQLSSWMKEMGNKSLQTWTRGKMHHVGGPEEIPKLVLMEVLPIGSATAESPNQCSQKRGVLEEVLKCERSEV